MNDILREAEIQNFKTTWQLTACHSERGETCTEQGYLLTSCGMAFADYNLAFPISHTAGTNRSGLRKISRWFEQRQLPFYLVQTSDSEAAQPTQDGKTLVGMLLKQTEPTGLLDLPFSIVKVSTPDQLKQFHQVIAEGFQLPQLLAERLLTNQLLENPTVELWLGLSDNQPAVTCMITHTRSIAGLYWLTVAPQHKGQHWGQMMVRHCLNQIAQHDIQYCCLQTQPELAPYYEKLGFHALCQHQLQRISA